jgi:putative transposase
MKVTPEQRAELEHLRREPGLKPIERDRVEMVLLSTAGWAVPRIAAYLKYCEATVRRVFVRFEAQGPAGLRRRQPGPPPDQARRTQVTAELTRLLEQPRTWTTRQLVAALEEAGIRLSPRQVRRYLRDLRARYGRTARTLDHKQDPARVAIARALLDHLKKEWRPAS